MLKSPFSIRKFLLLYLLFAIILSLGLIFSNIRSLTEPLILLIIPVFHASIVYPRYVYILSAFIATLLSAIVIFFVSNDPTLSYRTLVLLVLTTVFLAEIIHRLVTNYRSGNEFINQVVGAMGQGLTVTDINGRFEFVNPSYAHLLGYTVEEMLGKSPFEITHPDDIAGLHEARKQRLAGESSTYESRIQKTDGTYIPVTITGIPFKRNGRIVGMIATITDLTRYKKVEEELRQAEIRYRTLVEQIPAVTYICTTELNFRTLYISPQIEQLLGYNQAEWLTKQDLWRKSIYPDDFEWVTQTVEKCSINHLPFEGDYRLVRYDGQIIWVRDRAVDITNSNGEAIFCQGILVDITSQKKMLEEQLKTSKLESLGQLAGGIAHDFNNLLTAIIGSLSLIQMSSQDNAEIDEYVEQAQVAINRARNLTQQLLTFAKGGSPVKKPTNLADIVRDATLFVLSGSNTTCTFEFTPNLWLASVDDGQISRVIQNIVLNAVQAMPGGGVVRVQVQNLIVDSQAMPTLKVGNYVKIVLIDEGNGIAPEHLPLIFDPYFSTKPNGSGLGLAICYSIVKQHQGYIEVESQVRVGTTFRIYLPAEVKPLSEPEPKTNLAPEPATGRILIMDDDPMIRKALRALLTRFGFMVEETSDGNSAIAVYQTALAANQKFALVIMDLTIPGGMGGKEAVRHILELDPQANVIVSSGYSDDPVLSDYQTYGFVNVLPKPYNLATLRNVLAEVLPTDS
jgi:PAS domain S-box-containing protein